MAALERGFQRGHVRHLRRSNSCLTKSRKRVRMTCHNRVRRQQRILNLLQAMADASATPADRHEKFCRLFFTELRFNHVNVELNSKKWEGASQILADPPLLFTVVEARRS